MCSPVLAVTAVAANIGGTLLSAGAAEASGRAAQNAAYAQAAYTRSSGDAALKDAQYQASILKQKADYATWKSKYRIALLREKLKKVMASQRVGFSTGNVDISSGSPLSVAMDSMRSEYLDEELTRYEGENEWWAFMEERKNTLWRGEVQRTQAYNQASLQEYQGNMAAYSGRVKAGTLLVGGIGSTATMIAGGSQMGLFDWGSSSSVTSQSMWNSYYARTGLH